MSRYGNVASMGLAARDWRAKSMRESDLSLFCCSERPELELTFRGERDGTELLEGAIRADGAEVTRVRNGVACFVHGAGEFTREQIRQFRDSGLIARNWANETEKAEADQLRRKLCAQLADVEGAVLEVAAGPGGGNMAPLLHRCRRGRLIVSNISEEVLALWREFLFDQGRAGDVCLAAFDARDMPVRNGSIAAASNVAGFANIPQPEKAVRETFRVLKPDGVLCSINLMVDPEDWARMPVHLRRRWEKKVPGFVAGETEILTDAGFRIESRELAAGRELVPEQDDIACSAAEHGVVLHVSIEHIGARKPD